MSDLYVIDAGSATELERLQRIEQAAAIRFPEHVLPPRLRGGTMPLGDLRAAYRSGWLRVARLRTDGLAVGFACAERRGPRVHLHEMDVLPEHGGRGVGRALLAAVLDAAWAAGCEAVTLTTFRELRFNAPFYARHGFRALEPDELDAELAAVLAAEARAGIDPSLRVAMRCPRPPD